MRKLIATKQFKKDLKLSKKRKKNLTKLMSIIEKLRETGKLPLKYRPHRLSGEYRKYFECHIEPD